jgi:hypothetical protein
MIASRHEVSTALRGAFLLARLDRGGMAYFDRSEAGFWKSFTAALLVYPAFLILLVLRVEDAEWAASGAVRLLIVETIGYVIGWTAFPLIMLPISRFLGRDGHWLDFIVAYNWSQVLQYALFLAATILAASGAFPTSLASGIVATAIVALLLYEWFVARVSLDTGAAGATMIVLVDLVLSELISHVTDALH